MRFILICPLLLASCVFARPQSPSSAAPVSTATQPLSSIAPGSSTASQTSSSVVPQSSTATQSDSSINPQSSITPSASSVGPQSSIATQFGSSAGPQSSIGTQSASSTAPQSSITTQSASSFGPNSSQPPQAQPRRLPQPQPLSLSGQEHDGATPIAIVNQTDEVNPDGSFHYSYETANGIKVEESGEIRNLGGGARSADGGDNDTSIQAVHGSFSFTAPDGIVYTVTYVADENGFQPKGDHLPTPPPVPEAIARSLTNQTEDQDTQNVGQRSARQQTHLQQLSTQESQGQTQTQAIQQTQGTQGQPQTQVTQGQTYHDHTQVTQEQPASQDQGQQQQTTAAVL